MENKLDQYFRENLQDREFEFENAWWKQAEELLDVERRRSRRRLFAWWGGAMVAVAVAVAGIWLVVEKSGDETGEIATQNVLAPGSEEDAVSGDFFEKNQTPATPEPESKTMREGKTGGPFFDQKNTENQQVSQQTQPPPTASVEVKTEHTPLGNALKPGDKKSKIPAIEPAGNPATGIATQEKNRVSNPSKTTSTDFDSTPETARRTEDLTALSLLATSVRGDFLKNLNTAASTRKRSSHSRLGIGFTAAQLMQAGASSREQAILGHRAGLVVRYEISKTWFVSSGLQYHRRGGTFEVSKAAESRRYRFGLEVDSQLLKPSSLHYVSMPVLLGWQRGRHIAESGLLLDYLAGLRGARGTFEKTTDLPPRKEFQAQQDGWLAEDGYKKMTVTAQLGYRYRVNRQLSLGVSANYTVGRILAENYEPPVGNFLLKEADKFYLSVQAVYFIK